MEQKARIKYDPQTDTLTLRFGDTPIAESDEIEPGVIVDYDANGQIVGVELLDASTIIQFTKADLLTALRASFHQAEAGQIRPISELDKALDELAEKEYLDYLQRIGAIREDGTIDHSKIKYHRAQTFEELEALLWERKNRTNG